MQSATFQPMGDNPITMTDSYKASHWLQYPPDVTSMYSYFESRGGRYRDDGLLRSPVLPPATISPGPSRGRTSTRRNASSRRTASHSTAPAGSYLVERYGGRLPVRIRAVPEGIGRADGQRALRHRAHRRPTRASSGSCRGSRRCSCGSGTRPRSPRCSFYCKRHILDALVADGRRPARARSTSSCTTSARAAAPARRSARIGGAAHLVNFMGSDTVEGVRCANHYYDTPDGGALSIPAAEHSTITMWGRESEEDAYRELRPTIPGRAQVPAGTPKIAACVSDSYDVFHAVENLWCGPSSCRRWPRLGRQARHPARLGRSGDGRPQVPPDPRPQGGDADATPRATRSCRRTSG